LDTHRPLLSIITVVFNAENTLPETLESITSQTFTDYELVIVDGGSTDGTLDFVNSHRHLLAMVISEPDEGIYDAMNKGISLASGEYVQFLNAGDTFYSPDSLQAVFGQLASRPHLIYGDINIITLEGKSVRQIASDFTEDNLIAKGTGVLCHQAMFVRRDAVPVYDKSLKFKGELNWYFDLREIKDFAYLKIDTIVVNYALGGFGYQNFLSNRLEWVYLVLKRFGFRRLYESRLIPFLLVNARSRYKWLNALCNLPLRVKKIFD